MSNSMADEAVNVFSVTNFMLHNTVSPDAMSAYASQSGSVQNLYLKQDVVSPWPAWKLAFFPSYTRATYQDESYIYFLTYNPLEEIGFLSKWKKEENKLRYVSLEACTSEYLSGTGLNDQIKGQPLWEQKFLSTGALDLTTDSLSVVTQGVGRFNSAPKVEQMLADLEKPKEYMQAATGKSLTDRDLALFRAASAAKRLDLALSDPQKKQEIYDAMDCIRQKPNALCPNEQTPASSSNVEKLNAAVIPVGFMGTLHQDLVFTGMTFAPGVVTVTIVQDGKIVQRASVDFDATFDKVLFPSNINKYKPLSTQN
jgi:hypothetical protein